MGSGGGSDETCSDFFTRFHSLLKINLGFYEQFIKKPAIMKKYKLQLYYFATKKFFHFSKNRVPNYIIINFTIFKKRLKMDNPVQLHKIILHIRVGYICSRIIYCRL